MVATLLRCDAPDSIRCATHVDTPLIPTRRGWVCPEGCSYEAAGRLWRDLPPTEECQP